jgi:hypothetical protein
MCIQTFRWGHVIRILAVTVSGYLARSKEHLVPAGLNMMADSLNISGLLGHFLVALVPLDDGSVDVSQPLMVLVVHQLSVSTLTRSYGHA